MNNIFKNLLAGFIATALFSSSVLAAPISIYNFPVADALLATIATAANSTQVPYQIVNLEPLPHRSSVKLLEGRNKVPVAFFVHKNKQAPLIFLISGVGGNSLSGNSLAMAGDYHRQGFNVITLPNPLNWQYALGVSKTGVPGYLPHDAPEFYEFMRLAFRTVKESVSGPQALRPKSFSVVGYSYGGLLAGYLMKVDNQRKAFNFKRALIINPGIDLVHGVQTLDGFYDAGANISNAAKDKLMSDLFHVGSWLLGAGLNGNNIQAALRALPHLDEQSKQWLVGNAFREDLRDVVFVSQQIKDRGLLKQPASTLSLDARRSEAKKISFQQYINLLVLPTIRTAATADLSYEQMMATAGLYPLLDLLASDARIYMHENADDFLVKDGDLELLAETLGSRWTLYPRGGHVGNSWFEKNRSDRRAVMAPLLR